MVQGNPGSSKSGAFSGILVNVSQGIDSIILLFDVCQITFGLRFVKIIFIPFGALWKMLSGWCERLTGFLVCPDPVNAGVNAKPICLQSWLDEDTNLLGFTTKSKLVQPSSTPGRWEVDSDQ